MPSLIHQRCFNHVAREAAARCPGCTRYFCRECVTEHDDRVLCAACLARVSTADLPRRRALRSVTRGIQIALGILIAWFFFFALAEALQRIPDEFHEGNIWLTP
jgi:hypothetical protein